MKTRLILVLLCASFLSAVVVGAGCSGKKRRKGPVTETAEFCGHKEDITTWKLVCSNPRNFDGVAKFKNLTTLWASAYSERGVVSDVSALADIPKLKDLDLSNTSVVDLQPLSKSNRLQRLGLFNSLVTDLSPLSTVTQLEELRLGSSPGVASIDALSSLTKLKSLDLARTEISSIAALKTLVALEELDVSGTKVTDIGVVRSLSALKRLDISMTKVADLSPLRSAKNLTALDVGRTEVSDLSPLAGLALETLDLGSGGKIQDIAPLANLTHLKSLTFQNAGADLSPLAGHPTLRALDVSGPEGLALVADGSLSSMESLKLKFRRQKKEPVRLTALKKVPNLTTLRLGHLDVVDATPLSALKKLETLYLSDTSFEDVTPLTTLPRLKSIKYSGKKLPEEQSLQLRRARPELKIGHI